MKTLLVMRHGKSSWDDPSRDDYDRPLKKRGRRAAELIGAEIQRRGLTPDLVISSGAKRARKTAAATATAVGYAGRIELTDRLYFNGVEGYLDSLAEVDDAVERVLVVGHNPHVEGLTARLTGEQVTFPTAALAVIELDTDAWAAAGEATGRLVSVTLPRELEKE